MHRKFNAQKFRIELNESRFTEKRLELHRLSSMFFSNKMLAFRFIYQFILQSASFGIQIKPFKFAAFPYRLAIGQQV